MSTSTWIAALFLYASSWSVLAEPLTVSSQTSGVVTYSEGIYGPGGNQQAGAPITVWYDIEHSMFGATIENGTLTTQPYSYFHRFGLTIGGADFPIFDHFAPFGMDHQMRLKDNFINAAGALVDVFELTASAQGRWGLETFTLNTHLEFRPDTFSGLDAWSILALEDATLLNGTLHLLQVIEDRDAIYTRYNNLNASINDFNVHFGGPGSVPPAVPEPGQLALLLAGLTGMGGAHALRRRRSRPDV